ncbi:reprolysin-like metallopeptidase [Zhouia sp. PK063]|uniref:reprolysin-like metallopeptidase n=1 Tax=Zhouia sp. PK063 TaxID=3373602 RepID=UPI0037B8FB6B
MRKNYLALLLLLFSFLGAYAQQNPWAATSQKVSISQKISTPVFELDLSTLQRNLSGAPSRNNLVLKSSGTTIAFPVTNSTFENFTILETHTLSPALAAKYPNIKSYVGTSTTTHKTIRFSIDTFGFHGMVLNDENSTFINPIAGSSNQYNLSQKSDYTNEPFLCKADELSARSSNETMLQARDGSVNDGTLRTYRLALACTGEYAQFQISQAGLGATATTAEKKAAVLSAMNTTMTRVNGIYERDLSITMQIIDNDDSIIFLDSTTDGLTNDDGNSLINEIQSIIDTNIGSANYDIGHVFSTGGGGIAQLQSVCTTNKARGVTGLSSPVGDLFAIDYVCHEMGHQFGATHTFNNSCSQNRTNATAVEPGSGSTIMAYAGICAPNVQSSSDDYFHAVSITQIYNYVTTGNGSCATETATGNNAPVADAGTDYTIPGGTTFVLTGTATDADNDNLTYDWEQIDNEVAAQPPVATSEGGPLFRSYEPTTSSKRYFPRLTDVLTGTTSQWEVLPTVSRTLNFSLLVRDNNANGGQTYRDDNKITVDGSSGPFVITSQTTGETWVAGTQKTITWDVANTNNDKVNTTHVNIILYPDHTLTNGTVLAQNVANDGSQTIIVPGGMATTTARIMVQPVNNVFFAVNGADLTIQESSFVMNFENTDQSICAPQNSTTFPFTYQTYNGFNETTSLTAENVPAGLTVSFSQNTVQSNNTSVNVNITGIDNLSQGNYTIDIKGTAASLSHTIQLHLAATNNTLDPVTLTSPANNSTDVVPSETLEWSANAFATSYIVEIATDANFNTIVESSSTSQNTYTPKQLASNTTYYWHVKPVGDCASGDFSTTFKYSTILEDCKTFTNTTNYTISAVSIDTVRSFITIQDDIPISSLSVGVSLQHDFVEDLTIKLTSPSGKSAILVSAACGDNNDISATFSDDGSALQCLSTAPTINGTFTPQEALSTFAGESTKGTWTLTVIDDYDEDGGSLNQFVLNICAYGNFKPDSDNDGILDEDDDCPNTPEGTTVDVHGCPIFTLPNDNFIIKTASETCSTSNDGSITINAQQTLAYTATLTNSNGSSNSKDFSTSTSFNNLSAGSYELCITVNGETYEQCYDLQITEPADLSVQSYVNEEDQTLTLGLEGSDSYNVTLNGITTQTSSETLALNLKKGLNVIEVSTLKDCQGVFRKEIFIGSDIMLYPNPVTSTATIYVEQLADQTPVTLSIFTLSGQLLAQKSYTVTDQKISNIDFSNYSSGIYLVKVEGETISKTVKVIKK